MDGNQIFMLGLGIQAPWKIIDQHLDTAKSPNELILSIGAERGSLYPCPKCGSACPAHDYKELTLAASELLPASLLYHSQSTQNTL